MRKRHRPTLAPVLAERALSMRWSPTASEETLWRSLRAKQLGAQFRRQYPLGRYIVDFVATRERLVVEVDGDWHRERARADAWRDAELGRMGYQVLRLDEGLVMHQLPEAVALVRTALGEPP